MRTKQTKILVHAEITFQQRKIKALEKREHKEVIQCVKAVKDGEDGKEPGRDAVRASGRIR